MALAAFLSPAMPSSRQESLLLVVESDPQIIAIGMLQSRLIDLLQYTTVSASTSNSSRICKSHKHNKRAKRSSYFQLGGRRKRSSITGIHTVLNSTKMIKTFLNSQRNTTRGQKLTNLKHLKLNLGESIHPYFDHSNQY